MMQRKSPLKVSKVKAEVVDMKRVEMQLDWMENPTGTGDDSE